MSFHRACCCGGEAGLFCASTSEWVDCTGEVCIPGIPGSFDITGVGDRFCLETSSEPSDWQVVRYTGTAVSRSDSIEPNLPNSYTETRYVIDATEGLIFQYGRPGTIADIEASYGTGHTVLGGAGSQFPNGDPNLYVGSFRILNSRRIRDRNGNVTESNSAGGFFNVQPTIGFGGAGAVGLVTRAVPFLIAGCSRPAFRVGNNPSGGSVTESYVENFSGSATSASISSRLESIRSSGSSFVRTNDGSASLQVRARLGTLGSHWEGPANYDLCANLGPPGDPDGGPGVVDSDDPTQESPSGSDTIGGNENASAIEQALRNDPLRTCRGCGG